MPTAMESPRSKRGEDPITSSTKGVSWGKAVDEKEEDNHPVLDNLVATYDTHGDPKEVLYLREFRGRFKNRNPSKVVVKVEACTVSRMDCQIRRNVFHHHVETPYVPGTDMVGTVIQVGTKAKRYGFHVGDRVCALDLNLGGNARYVIAHSYQLIKVPLALDAAEVACLIRTYITAYQCLYRVGETVVRRGDKVLIVGGSGCVGQAIVQLAKAAGATEIYATGGETAESKRFIDSLGAMPLGRQPWQWLPIVEGEMDIVIDSVCGDGYESSYKALNKHGKLVILGDTSRSEQGYLSHFLSQHKIHLNMLKASYTMERATIYDIFEEYNECPDQYERDLRLLFKKLEEGEINPRIVKCIPLNEIANAHKEMEEGGVEGNIVCVPFCSEVTTHKKKPRNENRTETEFDKGRSPSPQVEAREEGNTTSRGECIDIDQEKTPKVSTLNTKRTETISVSNDRVADDRSVPEDRSVSSTTSTNRTDRLTKKLLGGKNRTQTEAKRTKAKAFGAVTKIRTEARKGAETSSSSVSTSDRSDSSTDRLTKKLLGGKNRTQAEAKRTKANALEAVENMRAEARKGEKVSSQSAITSDGRESPKGILKESSFASTDLPKRQKENKKDHEKAEKKVSIEEKIEATEQKATAAAAADVQAIKLEAELLKADAEAKRAEAEALRAKIRVMKAEMALLHGN